ncbi:hypothetical protein NADE_004818 [Nannochloris sp. 'desiccata']|nr:hypothetical protein NADE_004818 [Chlorella desiccata (nom. nud.)]
MFNAQHRPLVASLSASKTRSVVMMATPAGKLKVVVTGAGGRTGSLVMKKLLERSDEYEAIGILRSEKSARQLKEWGAADSNIFLGDILGDNGAAVLAESLKGADRLVVCTSAVPKIKPFSLVPVILAKIFKKEGVRPKFTFKENQLPEQVDWMGQKMQFDAAKAAGVEKCVVVGSMGGTDRDNFLNTIGDGNILVWKRRAEAYLLKSGLNFTVIHPGGLKDDEGGKRELVLDVDDNLISSKSKYRSIPRGDVAELCVQMLRVGGAAFDRRAIDVVAKDVGDGQPTTDFVGLLEKMDKNCSYKDMEGDEILAKF